MATALSEREKLLNELRFADFPHGYAGQERLDKYVIFRWLIGQAVLDGWECCLDPVLGLTHRFSARVLKKAGIEISVRIAWDGVSIGDELIETSR